MITMTTWGLLLGLAGCPGTVLIDTSDQFSEFAADGAWCWFADPRAVYHEGKYRRTYAGWVTADGDIQVGALDHDTGAIQKTTLYSALERDDHANPALLFLQDGRLVVFYAGHAGPLMHYRMTNTPEDLDSFGEECFASS